jgi:hypothetical protein
MKKSIVVGGVVLGIIYAVMKYDTDKAFGFREEVQLSSGEIVEIDRHMVMRPLGEVGGPGGGETLESGFSILVPNEAEKIPSWKSSEGLIPMVLDRDPRNNEWFVVSTYFTCAVWERVGKPAVPYIEFRLKGGIWKKVPLERELIGRRQNVLLRISIKGENGRHTLATKELRNRDERIAKQYLFITETPTCG